MDDSVSLRVDMLEQTGPMRDALTAGAKAMREQAPVLAALSDGQLGSVIWDAVRAKVDFDLFDWLVEGWASLDELRELKGHKGQAYHAFGKQQVRGELGAVVTMTVAGASYDLPFTLALIAEFEAVMLTVTNGRITAFLAGACDLSLETRYRETVLGGPTKIKTLDSPFRHTLKAPGLAIP